MFRHLTRPVLAFALLTTLLLTLVACGGDDGDEAAGGGETLTKEEVIEQGDAICAEAEEKLDAVEGLDTNPFGGDNEAFLDGMDEGIQITEERLEGFRDLNVPEDDRETIDRLIELQEDSLERVREFRTAVEEGDQEKANALVNANAESAEEAEELANEYGFDECGSLA